jgi:hypothetical protein
MSGMLWIIVAGTISRISMPNPHNPGGFILVGNRVVQDPGAGKPRL